jgi:hypothetical protein
MHCFARCTPAPPNLHVWASLTRHFSQPEAPLLVDPIQPDPVRDPGCSSSAGASLGVCRCARARTVTNPANQHSLIRILPVCRPASDPSQHSPITGMAS